MTQEITADQVRRLGAGFVRVARDVLGENEAATLAFIEGLHQGTAEVLTTTTDKAPSQTSLLRQLFVGDKIIIDACDGTKTIAEVKQVFTSGLDDDFERWGTNGGRTWQDHQ